MKRLPNELVAQLDGRNYDDLTKDEQIKEIEWCIERCYMNMEDYSDDCISKYVNDIIKLKRMIVKLKN